METKPSRLNSNKSRAGKRKSSSKATNQQQRSKRPRSPPRSPPQATGLEQEDCDKSSEQAEVKVKGTPAPNARQEPDADEKISILQKEIREMELEENHQHFVIGTKISFKIKFYVVKFEERPPSNVAGEYVCIAANWVRRRNPARRNGERTAYILYPPAREYTEEQVESLLAKEQHCSIKWDMYKIVFCYSAVTLEEAKQYLAKRVQLEKEIKRQNGGKKPKAKAKPYKFNKRMIGTYGMTPGYVKACIESEKERKRFEKSLEQDSSSSEDESNSD